MVLKVVRGKILETLELRRSPAGCVPFWHCGNGSNDRIVKELKYLVDNILARRLSRMIDRVQEESGRDAGSVPNRESC
jgi:hypothetical protein